MHRFLPLFLLPLLLLCLSSPALAQSSATTDDDSAPAVSTDDDDSAHPAAPASDAPSPSTDGLPDVTDDDAMRAASALLDYQKSGWGPLAAAILTLLIFFVRRLGLLAKLPKKALPWVAAGVAMATDVTAALVAGAPVSDALVQGLMLGAAAVGFWEMALKHGLGGRMKSGSAAVADELSKSSAASS